MVSNRRDSDRVVRRLPVRFWRVGEERSVTGYTTNISTTGMFVVTHDPLPKGARIRVEVLDPRSGFVVEAEVAHAHKVSLDLSALGPSGMGVRFLPIESLVRELFPEAVKGERKERTVASPVVAVPERPAPAAPASARPVGRASSKRVPIVRPGATASTPLATAPAAASGPAVQRASITVRFTSIEQFLSVYERDLRQGGLFVSTEEPARIGDQVEIDLHLPAPLVGQVRLRARVVHRIDPQGGQGMGGPNLLAGIGVELLDPRGALAALEPLLSRSAS
ncbi:MAG TPA: PilZ domain-containing protein [Thermoanaerobaculia bacterium]|jgi:Tfp pilus assembly protein PilZ|nr:PilZ domain-containing protein [Thermoanaerobaculia bacterium]